jgi:hypothetical protein
MNEQEWLVCADPYQMLNLLYETAGEVDARKLRLFACACVRRVWDQLGDGGREAVEVAERYADGLAGKEELAAAHQHVQAQEVDAEAAYRRCQGGWAEAWAAHAAWEAARAARSATDARGPSAYHAVLAVVRDRVRAVGVTERAAWDEAVEAEVVAQATLLRDLVNPFGAWGIDPGWRTAEVQALAEAIYRDRSFAELPALADALEDAGCADARVLDHLRGPGLHARGCALVDLLTGRGSGP